MHRVSVNSRDAGPPGIQINSLSRSRGKRSSSQYNTPVTGPSPIQCDVGIDFSSQSQSQSQRDKAIDRYIVNSMVLNAVTAVGTACAKDAERSPESAASNEFGRHVGFFKFVNYDYWADAPTNVTQLKAVADIVDRLLTEYIGERHIMSPEHMHILTRVSAIVGAMCEDANHAAAVIQRAAWKDDRLHLSLVCTLFDIAFVVLNSKVSPVPHVAPADFAARLRQHFDYIRGVNGPVFDDSIFQDAFRQTVIFGIDGIISSDEVQRDVGRLAFGDDFEPDGDDLGANFCSNCGRRLK